MNITKNQIDELNAVLKLEIVEADYAEKVQNLLKYQQKNAKMQGFRPGKVPFSLVKKMYETPAKVEEVQKLINQKIFDFIKEEKLNVLGQPIPVETNAAIDWSTQKDFSFDYEVGIAPEFEVELSAKKKFVAYDIQPDENLIDKYVEEITMRYGKVVSGEEVVAGDIVVTDVEENVEGGIVKLANIAVDRCSDDFKALLLGAKVGAEFNANGKLIYADVHATSHLLDVKQADLEAASEDFKFKIVSISRMEAAPVDQELFDKVYGPGTVDSVETFREKLKEEARGMLSSQGDMKLKNDITSDLIKTVSFELPDDFLKRFILATAKEPTTLEAVEAEYAKYRDSLKWQLIENKLITSNELKVEEEEVVNKAKELIAQNFKQYGQEVPEEDLATYAQSVLSKEEERNRLYDEMYNEKIIDLVKTKCKVEVKEVTYDEFVKITTGK